MKRVNIKDIRLKSLKELSVEIDKVRKELSKLRLEQVSNPAKDTNLLKKKRKYLAQLLTVLKEKS